MPGSEAIVGAMTEYKPSQVAELLGVSVDTVRRWCDEGRLGMTSSKAGRRMIEGADLARYLREVEPAWQASSSAHQSARNRFTGIVTRVDRDKLVAVVEIHAGPHRLVSMMTREAADELELQPGDLAVASVKSTNVVVEVPQP
jgi:molybdopterin-binding protein